MGGAGQTRVLGALWTIMWRQRVTDNILCEQNFFYLSGKAEAPEA